MVLVSGMITLAVGCGPTRQSIEGNIHLDGRPLDEAIIRFVPEDPAQRMLIAPVVAGSYKLPLEMGLAPGRYRVEVADSPPVGLLNSDHDHSIKAHHHRRRKFPYRYSHDSPLTATITDSAGDAIVLDFELTSK